MVNDNVQYHGEPLILPILPFECQHIWLQEKVIQASKWGSSGRRDRKCMYKWVRRNGVKLDEKKRSSVLSNRIHHVIRITGEVLVQIRLYEETD